MNTYLNSNQSFEQLDIKLVKNMFRSVGAFVGIAAIYHRS